MTPSGVDQGVQDILPYGTRFLFIKSVRLINSSTAPRLEALHNAQAGGGIDTDHFRGVRIYPGAFILEGCAQAAVCLYNERVHRLNSTEVPLLAHSKARFVKAIHNATGLFHVVELVKAVGQNAIFRGTSKKNGTVIMECELGLAVRSAQQLNAQ